jgi:hypothetical protein
MEAIEYIRKIPPPFRAIVEEIRELIFKAIPGMVENFKDDKLIYEKNGKICFIEKKPKQHVVLGFYKGSQLSDRDILLMGADNDRKYCIITNIEDINRNILTEILKEAASLN